MGANAVTTVPVYTAGEVLTAADMNITNSGIPVFATTVTRDAAFGGTGEKTLAEGQFAYIEATKTTQYYDGAAWQSVGTTPGLVFITGASFTAAATVSLPAATFSATYENYLMFFDITNSSTDIALTMRFRIGGADNTTSNYNNGFTGLDNLGTTQTKTVSLGTAFALTDISTGVDRQIMNLNIANPFDTSKTEINGFVGRQATSIGGFAVMSGGGIFNATTSFDSLSIICSTGNIDGNYRIYGYANS
jgi:hypothetical protein